MVQTLEPWDSLRPESDWLLMAKGHPRIRRKLQELFDAVRDGRVDGVPDEVRELFRGCLRVV